MRIQSIPAVFAFVNGQPVDGFMGALPESQLKQFVDRLGGQGSMAEEIEAAVAEARAAAANRGLCRPPRRSSRQVLQADREHAGALAGLARCQIAAGDLEKARATLALVPPAKATDPDVLSAKAALDLALNPVDTVRDRQRSGRQIEQEPRRFPGAARSRRAAQRRGRARARPSTSCSTSSARSASWNEEAARKQLVKFFEAWGPKDEFTLAGRRKLSSLLFS